MNLVHNGVIKANSRGPRLPTLLDRQSVVAAKPQFIYSSEI